jgi:hypothetical protein
VALAPKFDFCKRPDGSVDGAKVADEKILRGLGEQKTSPLHTTNQTDTTQPT